MLPVANQNYVFVHDNHPAISLLKANSDLLGAEITDEELSQLNVRDLLLKANELITAARTVIH